MFRRKVQDLLAKSPRNTRLNLEPLEDRSVPTVGVVTEFTQGFAGGEALTGIARGPDGNFWYTDSSVDLVGRLIPTLGAGGVILRAGSGATGITAGPDGAMWFTEKTGNRIGRVVPNPILSAATEFDVPGAGSAPTGITTGPDGALWFTEAGSDQIGRITTAGVITEFTVPGVGSAPTGIIAGQDGALWFTEAGSGQIGRITTDGVVTEFTVPTVGNSVSTPTGITAGLGAIFFTDPGQNQIGRITFDGQITQFNLPTGSAPQGIVVGKGNDLYFTESGTAKIGRLVPSALNANGPLSNPMALVEFSAGITPGSTPLGITTDANGDLWFTEQTGAAIGKLEAPLPQITVSAAGGIIRVYDTDLNLVRSFAPFPGYLGALSVAVADVNRNGAPDIIVGAASAGAAPHVKVFEGNDNTPLASFYAFDPTFTGGVSVAASDINFDGNADLIIGAGPGAGPQVKVIDATKLNQLQADNQIAAPALLANFYAFDPAFRGGVTVAVSDANFISSAELVIGAGPGAGPQVKVVDAMKLTQLQADNQIAAPALLANFYAFDPAFRGGVTVAVAVNNGRSDLVVGAGPGAGPQVKVIDGTKLLMVRPDGQIEDTALTSSFFAFDPDFRGGVRVSSDDLSSDGQSELVVSGGRQVVVIDGTKLTQIQSDHRIADTALIGGFGTIADFNGGVFVAAGNADHRTGPYQLLVDVLSPPT